MKNISKLELDALNKNGFVKINKYWSNKQINKWSTTVDNILSNIEEKDTVWVNNLTDNNVNRIMNLDEYDTVFKSLKKDLQKIASNITGIDSINCYAFELIIKHPSKSEEICFHQDTFYLASDSHKGIAFWIPLDKINEKKAPMHYIPTSHNISTLPHIIDTNVISGYTSKTKIPFYFFNIDKDLIKTMPKSEMIMTDVGDMILHCDKTIHKSSPNTDNKIRRAIVVHFFENTENISYISKTMDYFAILKKNKI